MSTVIDSSTENNSTTAAQAEKAFSLTIDEQNLAWLAIDVPNEKMNTLQAEFADQMDGLVPGAEGAVALVSYQPDAL